MRFSMFVFFQAEDGIRDYKVTGVQTCALPISDSCVARCWASSWRASSVRADRDFSVSANAAYSVLRKLTTASSYWLRAMAVFSRISRTLRNGRGKVGAPGPPGVDPEKGVEGRG